MLVTGGLAFYEGPFERFDRDRRLAAFDDGVRTSVGAPGTQVLSVELDAERSHRTRERVYERVCER